MPEQEMDWNSLAGYDDDKKKTIILLISVKRHEINSNRGYYYRFCGMYTYNNAAALKLRGCQSFPDHWVIDRHYEINFCYAAIYSGLLLARIATHSGI